MSGGEGSEFIGRVHFDVSRVTPVAQEIRPVNRIEIRCEKMVLTLS